MKRSVLFLAAAFVIGAAAFAAGNFFTRPADAQRNVGTRYEYAAITGNYSPYPAENASVASSAAQVCYMTANGCQNEEVRADLNIAKFTQDERIDNNPRFRTLAQERANQTAVAKAIAKLGSDGWEIVSSPAVEFDIYYTTPQGNQAIKEGTKSDRDHIWFKRVKQ